jgi:hypothetical protein
MVLWGSGKLDSRCKFIVHSMAVVWDGLGDGISIEPTELWLLLVRLELLCE